MRWWLVALALVGCSETIDFGNTKLDGLVSLSISPASATITVTGLDEPNQATSFTATGTYDDGTTRDLSANVTWSVDSPLPGAIGANGTYTTSNAAGGHVTVTAATGGLGATASLTVVVDATIVDSAFPPLGDPGTLFPSSGAPVIGDATHSPALLYPVDGTAFPQGVASTLVQYAAGAGNDTFRLTFDNDVLHLVVFTGGQRWAAAGAIWTLVAESGIDDPIRLGLQATSSSLPAAIYAGSNETLDFARDTPGGTVYYWSAATSGVMRGGLGAQSAGKLYPGGTTCVGCHAVSRDGSAMAMGYANEGNPLLQTIAMVNLATVINATANLSAGWSTYSPDDSLVLSAHDGVLVLRDAQTGAPVGTANGVVALPPMTFATHPDWSPDGTFVAVALTTKAPNDKDVDSASIALLPFSDGSFGAPQVVVASTGNENNYFPRWSPDGEYLAYVHATSSSHNATTAELRLVPAAGGTPVVLAAASDRTSAGMGGGFSDTMPAWSPSEGELSWLAFTSLRPYGAVMPTAKNPQIWIAGLDLSKLAGGAKDPSFAAFWLPCQDVTVVNNLPVWSGSLNTDRTLEGSGDTGITASRSKD